MDNNPEIQRFFNTDSLDTTDKKEIKKNIELIKVLLNQLSEVVFELENLLEKDKS